MNPVPRKVEAVCDLLVACGFVKSHEERSESFGDASREYDDGDLVFLVSRDRGHWSVDLRSRSGGMDTFDIPVVRTLITGDASRDTLSLDEVKEFLQSNMAEIRTSFEATELAGTVRSLRALMAGRAKRRLGF